jgi:type IV pilus assembly protein PilF
MKIGKLLLLLAVGLWSLYGCAPDPKTIKRAEVHYGLGYDYLQRGDPTSALRELLEAEKLDPKDPAIQHALGLALNAKGKYMEALDHYKQALLLDPKYTEVHNAMGATYLELGQWDNAIREFNIVLKDLLYLTPFYVLNNLGWAYYKKGDLPHAAENYKKALDMKPDFGLARYNLGLAYRDSKKTDLAIAQFQQVITLVPNFMDAHFQLGQLYFNAGKKQEAQKSFEEVVRLGPQSDQARMAQQYLDLLKKSPK